MIVELVVRGVVRHDDHVFVHLDIGEVVVKGIECLGNVERCRRRGSEIPDGGIEGDVIFYSCREVRN